MKGSSMRQHSKLTDYLKLIEAVYDIDHIVNQPVDVKPVTEYYTQSQLGYGLLHSMDGAVHMALTSDGRFNREDYYAQVNFVHHYLSEHGAIHILEIARGKGFNTLYLAQKYNGEFAGIDVTPVHVMIAQRKAVKLGLTNAQFEQGDFHALRFNDQQFDCAFEIESLCHAIDLQSALDNIHRVLKSGADFILFDCFKKRYSDLTPDETVATQLIEKSMSVLRFPPLDEFLTIAESVGFQVIELEDISYATMPNLVRFENMARWILQFSTVGRLLKWLLPEHFTQNAIAGLLMPIASQENILGYYRIILRRQ
jgi:SAM-dependent methyltransferase